MTACLLAMAAVARAQAPAAAANPNPELVGKLTQELGVTPKQAVGGTGAIFGMVKSQMTPANFNKLAAVVPGMGKFLKAAPQATPGGSAVNSIGSMAGGGKAGGLASLAGSFQSLGLSPGMAGKFVPVIQNYIGSKGGSSAASLFAGALK